MEKFSALEDTKVTDPKTKLPIRVSTTTRKMFRYIHRNNQELGYDHMRNTELNQIIAKEFSDSADKVVHYFKLKSSTIETKTQDRAEIRNWHGTVMFFISAIRPSYIDVMTLQSAYRPAKYKPQGIK